MINPADVEKLIDNPTVFRGFGESTEHEVALSTLAREWIKMREALETASAECETHEQTRKKLDTAIELLKSIEWVDGLSDDYPREMCPVCGIDKVGRHGKKSGLHDENCALWNFIKPEGGYTE